MGFDHVSSDVNVLLAIIEAVGIILGVIVGIRLGLTSIYRQTAEGWKARAEEAKAAEASAEKQRAEMRERLAVLESKPDLEQHARLLAGIVELVGRLDDRMVQHEEQAAVRHEKMMHVIDDLVHDKEAKR